MSFLDKVIFFQFHHHVFNREDTFFFPYYYSQKNIRFKYVRCVHLRCNLVKNQVSFFYFKTLFYKKFGNYRYPTRYVRSMKLSESLLNRSSCKNSQISQNFFIINEVKAFVFDILIYIL